MTHSPNRWHWLATVAALLVVGWLAIGGFGGPKVGELSSVASNNSADYLPTSSEAAQVQSEMADFKPADAKPTLPAIVVAQRDSGITPSDQRFLTRTIAQFEQQHATGQRQPAAGQSGASGNDGEASGGAGGSGSHQPGQVQVSKDGKAAQAVIPMPSGDTAQDQVASLRDALTKAPHGLHVYVAGPAGQTADLIKAFSGIDGMLLLVAGLVVATILLVVYRGPLLVLLVLASAVFALSLAALVVYHLADSGAIQLSGMSQGILFILVFGAATDYALLLVSRYRQHLRDEQSPTVAMRSAWRAVLPPITASAATVILGVLCLMFSDLASTKDLGPVAAIGIAAAYLASMTFLPAALMLCRRTPFWPVTPHTGTDHPETSGLWKRISAFVERYPRRIWVITALVLLGCVAMAPTLKAHGTTGTQVFLTNVDSVTGQHVLDEHFPGGTGTPTIILANRDAAHAVKRAAADVRGVDATRIVTTPASARAQQTGRAEIQAVLQAPASSQAALDTVQRIRDAVHPISGADAKVGGQDALQLDTNQTSERDRTVIIPIVLVVVFLVLALLLRALVAPVLLIATVVLSYVATLGVSAMVFNHVFHFPGADPAVPLFAFVFLVALGIDYNIFLMTRVREESARLGTHHGTIRGLALTGGVITSAGVVLAATFAALSVLPILFLAEIAFLVAFGVLLDTIVVRSLLVPALTLEVGRRMWWPARLSRQDSAPPGESADSPSEQPAGEPADAVRGARHPRHAR